MLFLIHPFYSPYPTLWDKNFLDNCLDMIRGENLTEIEICRDDPANNDELVLGPFQVRIARLGSGDSVERDGASVGNVKDVHQRVTILGGADLDIEPDDRFFHQMNLYRVVHVAHHQHAPSQATTRVRAHAEMVK